MDTPAPRPRRRGGRRARRRIRVISAYLATCAIVLTVMTFTVSELAVQADRDSQVLQAALAAEGYMVSPSPSLHAVRAEQPQLTAVGQSDRPGGGSAMHEGRSFEGQQVATPSDAKAVDPQVTVSVVQRAQAANRFTELLIPAGVMIGIALAVVLGREVVLAARATRSRG